MLKCVSTCRHERGQTLILAVVLLSLCCTLLLGLFQVSLAVREKIRLQMTADMAVLSALNCQANGLNFIATANRAVLANDALAGQLNALVSESAFYSKLVDRFRNLLRFVPYAGPISGLIAAGARTFENLMRRAAAAVLPMARISNVLIRKAQESVRLVLPYYSLKAARQSVVRNMPHAKITVASEALLLHRGHSLSGAITELPEGASADLRTATMDRHTLRRNWRVRIAGFSSLKKTGGSTVTRNDAAGNDRLRTKVFRRLRWRWKTVLSTESRASDFGYSPPASFLTLGSERGNTPLSLSMVVRAGIPPSAGGGLFRQRELTAVAAGRLYYRRESRVEEPPNLFNPFWRAGLIPVAEEPLVRRIIPETVLKEVRH